MVHINHVVRVVRFRQCRKNVSNVDNLSDNWQKPDTAATCDLNKQQLVIFI